MDFLPIDTIGGLLAVIIGFSFIIFVHELGHFLVAKYFGIKCPQFAIGMGHAIVSWRKGLGLRRGSTEAEYNAKIEEYLKREADVAIVGAGETPADEQTTKPTYTIAQKDRATAALGLGETEYRLNWLPLGGYVKMLGQEDNDPTARSEDPRSFTSKSIGARAAVLSAGVIMNIIFGVLFFMIAFMIGVGFNAPIAGTVYPPAADVYAVGHEGDPAYKGILTDDTILTFNGEPIGDMSEVRINTALSDPDKKVRLGIKRMIDGKPVELTFEISPQKSPAGLLDLGINIPVTAVLHPDHKADDLRKDLAQAGVSAKEAATVNPGMRIIEAGGKPVVRYHDYERIVEAAQGRPVEIVLEDDQVKEGATKQRATITLKADAGLVLKKSDDGATRHLAGLVPAVTIRSVLEGSAAMEAGVVTGDVVVQVGDVKWPTAGDISKTVYEAKGAAVTVVVLRDGQEKTFELKPRGGILGISMGAHRPILGNTLPDSPASKLNLPAGSRITAVNGTKVETFADIQRTLTAAAKGNDKGFDATIDCEPNEGKTITPMTVKLAVDAESSAGLAQATWNAPLPWTAFVQELVILKGDTPAAAVALGIKKTHQSMLQVYLTLLRVAQGSVHPKNFQGPVGIAHTGTKIAKQGVTYLLFFLGLISVNLAVMNFLPIPVVDGGHIVFLIIEKIKGSPVTPKIQNAALFAGLAFLVCMFLYVTYNDILRLVFGVA